MTAVLAGQAGTAGGGPLVTLPDGLAAIRSGASERALCADTDGGATVIVLESASAARRRGSSSLAELRGMAHTPAHPGSTGEDLEPARAVRRALADGGMNAREISCVAIHAVGPRAHERATYAVARGLGRFADGLETTFDDPSVAAHCVAAFARAEVEGAVAMTIDPVSGNLALAFARPR